MLMPPIGDDACTPTRPGQKKKKKAAGNAMIPYKVGEKVLLVGEGNFSFAAALATHLGTANDILATSFDHKEQVRIKYADSAEHEAEIEGFGGEVRGGMKRACRRWDRHTGPPNHERGFLRGRWRDAQPCTLPLPRAQTRIERGRGGGGASPVSSAGTSQMPALGGPGCAQSCSTATRLHSKLTCGDVIRCYTVLMQQSLASARD